MTNTRDSASPIDAVNEELIDTLIAISVVAKRLAAKLRQSNKSKVKMRKTRMNKRNEILQTTDTVIEKGDDFLDKAKDFIACVEILLVAATGFKAILEKYDGGVYNK